MQKPEETGDIILASLCQKGRQKEWFKRGAYLPLWLDEHADEAVLQDVVAQLEAFAAAHEWAVPRLLLADAYLRLAQPPLPKVQGLLQSALGASEWLKEPEWLALWCHHVSAGLAFLLQLAFAADDEAEVARWRQRVLELPWEQAAKSLTPQWMHRLCRALSDVGAWGATKRLVERCSRMHPTWPISSLWGAFLAMHEASTMSALAMGWDGARDASRARILTQLEAGLDATEENLLDDRMWCDFARFCTRHNAVSLAERCLLQVQARDELIFLQTALAYALAIDALPTAQRVLGELKTKQSHTREWIEVECGVLLALRQFAAAEALLDEALGDEEAFDEEAFDAQARPPWLLVLQALLWLETDRAAPGLAAFRRCWSMPPDLGQHPWFTSRRIADLLSLFGDGFRTLDDDHEALSCYMQGLRVSPTPQRFLSTSSLLFKHGQFADARALLQSGISIFSEELSLRYGMFMACAGMEEWDAAQTHFGSIHREWFRTHQLDKAWLLGQVQLSLATGDLLGAFEACETMLDAILEDEVLRSLREGIVAQVLVRFRELSSQQSTMDATVQRSARLEQELAQVMAHHHAQQGAFASITSAHEALQREIAKRRDALPDQRLPEALLESAHPGVAALVSDESRQALTSALFLQQQMLASVGASQHDFGPVVLQLARAVEGEVNRTLVDPLLAYVLEQGGGLGDFPPISIGTLAPAGNRLSLGDAARILYHQMELPEADGSVTTLRNPHSHEQHARWLAQWWGSAALRGLSPEAHKALQHQLPHQLQRLAGLRNQAGHAGKALTREQAESAMTLVFGGPKKLGLLPLLTKLPS